MKTKAMCFVVCTFVAVRAAGAGLLNGGFESPSLAATIEGYAVAPAGFAWVIASGDIDLLSSGYWQPSSGSQSVELNGASAASIYQDFTFNEAGLWTVKFDLSANPDMFARGDSAGTGLKSMQVDFGIPGAMTNLGVYSLDSAPRSVVNMGWVSFATPQVKVSTGVVYRLQCTSLTPGIAGPVLDNVSLSPVVIPRSAVRVSEVEVCWESVPLRLYEVQYRSELTTNTWMNLFGTNIAGTGATICAPDRVPMGQPRRFYRVIFGDE